MSNQRILTDFISTHPAFASLDSSGRSFVLANARLIPLKKGGLLFEKNAPGKMIYYIAKGQVSLRNENGKRTQPEGTFLGIDAVFSQTPYRNTVKALEDTVVIGFHQDFLLELTKEHPEILPHFTVTEIKEDLKVESNPAPDTLKPREILGYLSTFFVPLALYYFLGGTWVDPAITIFLCVLATTVTLWFFRLFPSYIPAIFFLLATLSLGLSPPEVILHGFATQTFIILISAFTLGAAILRTGLGHRVMLLFFSKFSTSYLKSNFALFVAGALLTPLMPSRFARAEIAAPMYVEASHLLRFKKGSSATTQLALALFYGITLFSSVFLSGSLLNYMVLALLPEYMLVQFSWLLWIQAATVYGGIVFLGYLGGTLYYRKEAQKVTINKARLSDQLKVLGPATSEQRLVILAIFIFLIGILTTSFHKIETAWIAFFVMFFILLFGVLSTKEFRANIDWTFLILIATTIGISSAMTHLHVDEFLLDAFKNLMGDYRMGGVQLIAFSAFVTLIIRLLLPMGPAAIVAGTLTIPLALSHDVHPWVIAFTVLVMIDVWFLKYQSTSYILMRKHAQLDQSLLYDETYFRRFNLFMNGVKVLGLMASIPLWKALGMMP